MNVFWIFLLLVALTSAAASARRNQGIFGSSDSSKRGGQHGGQQSSGLRSVESSQSVDDKPSETPDCKNWHKNGGLCLFRPLVSKKVYGDIAPTYIKKDALCSDKEEDRVCDATYCCHEVQTCAEYTEKCDADFLTRHPTEIAEHPPIESNCCNDQYRIIFMYNAETISTAAFTVTAADGKTPTAGQLYIAAEKVRKEQSDRRLKHFVGTRRIVTFKYKSPGVYESPVVFNGGDDDSIPENSIANVYFDYADFKDSCDIDWLFAGGKRGRGATASDMKEWEEKDGHSNDAVIYAAEFMKETPAVTKFLVSFETAHAMVLVVTEYKIGEKYHHMLYAIDGRGGPATGQPIFRTGTKSLQPKNRRNGYVQIGAFQMVVVAGKDCKPQQKKTKKKHLCATDIAFTEADSKEFVAYWAKELSNKMNWERFNGFKATPYVEKVALPDVTLNRLKDGMGNWLKRGKNTVYNFYAIEGTNCQDFTGEVYRLATGEARTAYNHISGKLARMGDWMGMSVL